MFVIIVGMFVNLFLSMQELCIMSVHIQKKEEPAALPMYHVLEGPTPVETTPDTQESEVGH